MNAVIHDSKNWAALLELNFRAAEHRTQLIPSRRYGPLSVQRPFYPEQDVCHTYLLHPPGGVVGGDRLELRVAGEPGSHGLITTPGANKFYHSSGRVADVEQSLRLQERSVLEFLPHENIYFPGARVNLRTRVDLTASSRMLLWEKHCFGRPANAERFQSGNVISRLQVYRDGDLLFTDIQRIDAQEIDSAAGLRGNPVMASFIVAATDLEAVIDDCRALQPELGVAGITQPCDGLLIARYLGTATHDLADYFHGLWSKLRPAVLLRPACAPRIWST